MKKYGVEIVDRPKIRPVKERKTCQITDKKNFNSP